MNYETPDAVENVCPEGLSRHAADIRWKTVKYAGTISISRALVRGGFLCAMAVQGACAQTEPRSADSGESITYAYHLNVDNNADLCSHMGQVFNRDFRKLWDVEPLMPGDKHSPYVADGKYAFPKLPGVEHSDRTAVDLVRSKIPSSREFDAVEWDEGRIVTGSPPGVQISGSETPRPVLVAHFDFDHDGRSDTVMKYGFVEGYHDIRERGASSEYLAVWRGEHKEMTNRHSLWAMSNEGPESARPIVANGQYLRPFIHKDHAYVAQYEMVFADLQSGRIGPYGIASENMKILDFRFGGERDPITRKPIWATSIVCRYEMMQVNK